MNRREVILLSGAALAAQEGVAQAQQVLPLRTTANQPGSKVLLKYRQAKASYLIPKSDAKAVKHVNSLSNALSLTSDQQQSALAIFKNAAASHVNLKPQLKTARKSLSSAVFAGDGGGVSQALAAIANLHAQSMGVGASAQAAFYQLLTADQQTKLLQYRS